MATNDQVSHEQLTDASIDPNVRLPKHVTDAARAAEAFYQPTDQTSPNPDATTTHTSDPPNADAQATEAAERARQAEAQNPQPQAQSVPVPTSQDLQDDTWAGRYNSMRGRWENTQRQIGNMQEQLIAAGDEIGRLNALLSNAGIDKSAAPQNNQSNHNNVITDADRETYGDELIDTVSRIARGTVQPEIDALKSENAELKKATITTAQKDLKVALSRALPNWPAIQASDAWRSWLRLPNVYTGVVRGQMLKDAWNSAQAQVVLSLFQDFVKEVQATGGVVPTNNRQEQQAPPAPRDPAMRLEDLAAPGRARPAGGENPAGPVEKPFITRQEISQHYAKSRQGYYKGRQAEYDQVEAAIQSAQRDGRIRG